MVLGKFFILFSCIFATFWWLREDIEFGPGGTRELSSLAMPLLFSSTLSWFVGSAFVNVFGLAIDTILLCFCEDYKVHVKSGKQGKAFFPPTLRKACLGSAGEEDSTAGERQNDKDGTGKNTVGDGAGSGTGRGNGVGTAADLEAGESKYEKKKDVE